jgi:hypothetical protein
MRDPKAPKYLEADSIENCRLTAGETWEHVDPKHVPRGTKVIPIVVLYTIKRDGRVK